LIQEGGQGWAALRYFYHVLMELLYCVQPSTPLSGFCQVEGFLQSFSRKWRKERKGRREKNNILWEWYYNICFSALRLGFKEEEYSGSEGPTNEPCRVVVHLQNTTTEAPLALQLIPQTIPEDVAANSSLLTSTLSASSKTMCLYLCHATDLYLTLCPRPLGRGRQPGIQAYACAGIPWNLGILWTINNCQLH